MSSTIDPGPWSPSRWLLAVSIAFGIQAVFVFLFSARVIEVVDPKHDGYSVSFFRSQASEEQAIAPILARDPALLGRVHANGFTGSLWDQSIMATREYLDWTEPLQFYVRNQYQAGATFSNYVEGITLPASVVNRAHPELAETERPPTLPAAVSRVSLHGPIRRRAPTQPASLPAWPHTNLVQPTVVSVAIDRFGWAQSTLILSNSLSQADAYALNWLRRTRFSPAVPNRKAIDTRLTWGEVTFHWAAIPATNAVVTGEAP